MKRKIFEVVKLKNEDMATILEVDKDSYKVEVVGKDGKIKQITEINEDDIDEVIIAKQVKKVTFTKDK